MNDLPVERGVEVLKVGNFQRADGLDCHNECFIRLSTLSEGGSHGAQNAEDLRPIKPLTFTMFAKAHDISCLGCSSVETEVFLTPA